LEGRRSEPACPIAIKGSHNFSNHVSVYRGIPAGVLALDKAYRSWLHGDNINPSVSSVRCQQNSRPVAFFHRGDEGFEIGWGQVAHVFRGQRLSRWGRCYRLRCGSKISK
jgi:hypothetical protein